MGHARHAQGWQVGHETYGRTTVFLGTGRIFWLIAEGDKYLGLGSSLESCVTGPEEGKVFVAEQGAGPYKLPH